MSAAPATNGASKKSFAQVAAAAGNRPAVPPQPQVKHQSSTEANQNPKQPSEARAVPAHVNHAALLRQNSANGNGQPNNQLHDLMKSVSLQDGHLHGPIADSVKRENSDTKSVTSRTTLNLDEKESLRPDDSASMKAVEGEEPSSPSDSAAVGSKPDSNPDARAFRDQLHEIDRNQTSQMLAAQHANPTPPQPVAPQQNGAIVFPAAQAPPVIHPDAMRNGNQLPIAGSVYYKPPDEKLMEALASERDRLFVLKVEQDFIDFIKDSRQNELLLPQTNSFYRMLSHKLADYYFLGHMVDDSLSSVRILRSEHTRLAPPLINTEPKSQSTTPPPVAPTRKIMRRGTEGIDSPLHNGLSDSDPLSRSRSRQGQDGENEDDESGPKDRSLMTREERENRYNEARARIFKDFDSKATESKDTSQNQSEQDVSRSSSVSGNKKAKKNKRPKDDGFEARSAYTQQFGGQPYVHQSVAQSQHDNAFDNGFNPYAQYQMGPSNGFYPGAANMGFPNQQLHQQDPNGNFGWPTQHYNPAYPMQPNIGQTQYSQNGFDTSNGFQYPSPQMASQMTPRPHAPTPVGLQQGFQPQMDNMNWQQPNMGNQYGYANVYGGDMNGSNIYPGQYGSQFMMHSDPSVFNNPYAMHNMSNAQFNPRTQAFIPKMHPNQFGNHQSAWAPMGMPMQHQMSNQSFSSSNFGSPGPAHSSPSRRPNASRMSSYGHQQQQHRNSQNSISKFGNPSTLPAKPPPPASMVGYQGQATQFANNSHPHPLPSHPFAGPPQQNGQQRS